MAEEKTILTVDLYDNVLTEKAGDYTGKIRITGTTRTSDISNRIVKKRTEYRPETITNILDLSYDEMIEALAQGRCVVNKFGQWLLTINGSFDILPRTKGFGFVRRSKLTLTIHHPILPKGKGPENIKETMEEAYQAVMAGLPPERQGFIKNEDQ